MNNSHLFVPMSQQPLHPSQDMSSPMAMSRPLYPQNMAPTYPYYMQSFSTPSLASATPDHLTYDDSPNHHHHLISRPASAMDLSNGYLLQQHIHSAPHSQHTSPLMHHNIAPGSLSQHASPLLQHQQQLPHHQSYLDPDSHAYSVLSSSSPDLANSQLPNTAADNASANSEYMNALENDPYFIPVQGVLPPSKNIDGRYECQLCERSYTHAKHLKRHMMRHTGQKPYGCSWCSARFTRPDIRKRHVSKCKVRRKMEGMESIKIEEENPAKMISLKNKKLKENRQRKAAAAAAKKQTGEDPSSKSEASSSSDEAGSSPAPPSPKNACDSISSSKATTAVSQGAPPAGSVSYVSPVTNGSYISAANSAINTPVQDSLTLPPNTITPPPASTEFDPSVLKAYIKKEFETGEGFYSTPVLSSNELPLPPQHVAACQQPQQLPHHQTVYFRAMPTPSVMPSVPPTVSEYMTSGGDRSPVGYYIAVPPPGSAHVGHIPAPSSNGTNVVHAPNYGMGICYAPPHQHQHTPSQQVPPHPQMLTPQQYDLGLPPQRRAMAESSCMYGESPLETFVPPVYQEQQ